MRRTALRLLVWLMVAVSASMLKLAGVIGLDQYRLRCHAQQLLSDIRSLELRKSSYADARDVIDRWWIDARQQGPCRVDWCDVEISLTDFARGQGEFVWQTPTRSKIFSWLGARPATVSASIRVRNNVVIGKPIEEYVGGPCQEEFDGQTLCLTVMGASGREGATTLILDIPSIRFTGRVVARSV